MTDAACDGPPGGVNSALAAELTAMFAKDQLFRSELSKEGDGFRSGPLSIETMMAWNRMDVTHTDRLRAIVEQHGWPGATLVGEEAAEHAWLLAQHADRQLDTQRLFLAALRGAVAAGEAKPENLAYLVDRVAMGEGRPQIYGTQIADVRDGRAVPWPLENPEGLDARRAEVGLEPWAEYAAQWDKPG